MTENKQREPGRFAEFVRDPFNIMALGLLVVVVAGGVCVVGWFASKAVSAIDCEWNPTSARCLAIQKRERSPYL
jgi:hypothetical protein